MFGTILLTVLLLIGIPVGWAVVSVSLYLWAASRKTGCLAGLGILAGIILYLCLWVYGLTVAIQWWVEIAN